MRKELLILAMLVLLIGCAAPTPPVDESPTVVPTAPVPEAPVSVPPNVTAPVEAPLEGAACESNCMAQCAEDGANACGLATDYNMCVQYCGDIIRPAGCKGACASGIPVECDIIFENECKKDCAKRCA